MRDYAFSPRKLSVPSGATVRWRFDDAVQHDVTRGLRAARVREPLEHGAAERATRIASRVPGEYRLFCSLHPVDIPAIIRVR